MLKLIEKIEDLSSTRQLLLTVLIGFGYCFASGFIASLLPYSFGNLSGFLYITTFVSGVVSLASLVVYFNNV